ncbi:MAG: hypothetical protein AAGG81_03855 [Chlamydiota bacterium]
MMSEKESIHHNDYKELQEAITVIRKYSGGEIPLQEFASPLKGFKETIKQIGELFLHKFLSIQPKVQTIESELIKALETIKNHYHLIEKLKKGTKEEKKLAKLAVESIKSYNAHIDSNAPSPKWSDKITRFLASHALVTLPQLEAKKLHLPFSATTNLKSKRQTVDKLQDAFSKLACSLDSTKELTSKNKITTQELDLFRMKAITLLRDHKLKVKRETVQKAPIKLLSEDLDEGSISLFQTITPFPGETIELKGKFKRNPDNAQRPIPLSDTFHLTTSSTQTGFPHPSQYHGWSLAVQLIPVCPHHLDNMIHFSAIQEKRKELANTLLPMGSHNIHGKHLLKLKKEAFEAGKVELIPLHQTLSETIVQRSLCENCPTEPITHFFELLMSLPYAYDYLSETHAITNEKYIKIPYIQLNEALLLTPENFTNREDTQEFLIEKISEQEEKLSHELDQAKTDFEKITLRYIKLIGKALVNGTIPIILQELSENLTFAPPLLDEFSRRLQHSAYKQLTTFLDELSKKLPCVEEMENHLKTLIHEDIALFKGETTDEEENISLILNELETYYNQRYFSRNQ